jgi:hypothetical protein
MPKRLNETPAPQDQQIDRSPSLTIEQFGQDQLRDAFAGSFRMRRRQSIQLKVTPPTNKRNNAAERRSSTTIRVGESRLIGYPLDITDDTESGRRRADRRITD